ncbi:unnamed protein product [Albugo candida]|uniref:Uncharacterized protein n=1 Tax=Albugo candida TaxID=65357 RepID=A0A024GAR4_9STRA|nr:unnamed protein product [Albugo candida]|eukprot:CCI43936.1 unnamed protein product [Albugo candida]
MLEPLQPQTKVLRPQTIDLTNHSSQNKIVANVQHEGQEPIWGLKVEVATVESDIFLMAFYQDGDSSPVTPFKRCWPYSRITLSSSTTIKYMRKYDISFSNDDFQSQIDDAMKKGYHYEPESEIIYEHAIPGCWKLSPSYLNKLYIQREMLFEIKLGVTILAADAFVDMAPKGIYSFKWNKEKGLIAYAVDTTKISTERSGFIPERSLVIPEVSIGDTRIHKQGLRIRLSHDMIELSNEAYRAALAQASQGRERRDVEMEIKIPGNFDTNGFSQLFRLPIVREGTPIYHCSKTTKWVLGAAILRMFKISIDTTGRKKLYQIIRYKNSNEWSGAKSENSAAETSSKLRTITHEDSAAETSYKRRKVFHENSAAEDNNLDGILYISTDEPYAKSSSTHEFQAKK